MFAGQEITKEDKNRANLEMEVLEHMDISQIIAATQAGIFNPTHARQALVSKWIATKKEFGLEGDE